MTTLTTMTATDQRKVESLSRRINNAPDFGYDDEAVALTKVLAKYDLAWKWGRDDRYNEVVEVYAK